VRVPVLGALDISHVAIIIPAGFPSAFPRIGLETKGNKYGVWPHVEVNNTLCIYSSRDKSDASNPLGVVAHTLDLAFQKLPRISRGLDDAEFLDELKTYWEPTHDRHVKILFGPSMLPGKCVVTNVLDFIIAGSDEEQINQWCKKINPKWGTKPPKFSEAILLDATGLNKKPAEKFYGSTLEKDFTFTGASKELLANALANTCGQLDIIIRLRVDAGFGYVALKRQKARTSNNRFGNKASNTLRGFRPVDDKTVPPEPIMHRLNSLELEKLSVERRDPEWIHGRDHNMEIQTLKNSHVAFLGVGSLGSEVCRLAAQAGVGKMTLIDPGILEPENTSRHILGANALYKSKAQEMAQSVDKAFPHLQTKAIKQRWEDLSEGQLDGLQSADLIVSTTAAWNTEYSLNQWWLRNNRKIPIIYGWLEPFAQCGHAALVNEITGCFACGFDNLGNFQKKLSLFPQELVDIAVPACAGLFQPYGSIDVSHIVAMIAELTVSVLLEQKVPTHQSWLGSKSKVEQLGGVLADVALKAIPEPLSGKIRIDQQWEANPTCMTCQGTTR
jgi:molybdopterin/thiamine biosynthesis adenylyltransferase